MQPFASRRLSLRNLGPLFIFWAVTANGVCLAGEGDLDPTFGDGGLVTTDFLGPASDFGQDVIACQADGKIVVVGNTSTLSGGRDFALARYNPDGSLDDTFGTGGLVTTDFGSRNEFPSAAAIQADGKIVVVGSSVGSGFFVARYNPDGTLDTDFGTGGLVTTNFPGWLSVFARAVAIQADGKIVLVGSSFSSLPFDSDFALARYNSDGSLDTGFGTDGLVTTDLGSSGDSASDVAIQSDGKLVVVGITQRIGGFAGRPRSVFAVVRYNPNGSLDTDFGSGGLVTTVFSILFGNAASSVAIQADGKIVAVGSVRPGIFSFVFALARYNTDGSLDTGFDTDGRVTTDFGSLFDGASGVAIQADGKIVVGGNTFTSATGRDFALARYNTDGSLDTGFDTDGRVTTDFTGSVDPAIAGEIRSDTAVAMEIQADGKIVVGGATFSAFNRVAQESDFALARYNTDGSLDASFDTDGLVTTGFLTPHRDFAGDFPVGDVVAIQADGKIVVVGLSFGIGIAADSGIAVARYNPDGTLDTGFGTGGLVTTNFPGSSVRGANAVAIQADGKIVVVGETFNNVTFQDFALARYNPDGTLDTGFGTGGLVTTNFPGLFIDVANAVAIQADGKIVVGGSTLSSFIDFEDHDFALARYNPDGSLDAGFGTGGRVTTDFGTFDVAFSVAIQGDGKIVVAGQALVSDLTDSDFALARYNTDGSLDGTFGTGGLVTTVFGFFDAAIAMEIQADGKIVLAGVTFSIGFSDRDFALARYNPDGTLDTGFGTGGLVTTDFGFGVRSLASAVAIQADGKIVAAGSTFTDFALARYNPDGTLDTGFGTGGLVTTDFGASFGRASGVAIQADGKIVVAGTTNSGSPTFEDFALARYLGGALEPVVLAALEAAGINPADVPPDALDALIAAESQGLLQLVTTPPNQSITLQSGEVLVVGADVEVNGNVVGDPSNTVVLGDNVNVTGNVEGVGQLFIGGTNVQINGNFVDGVIELLVGPGADVSFNGNVAAALVEIDEQGSASINGDLVVTESLTMGQSASLFVGGNLDFDSGNLTMGPTASLTVGGNLFCTATANATISPSATLNVDPANVVCPAL